MASITVSATLQTGSTVSAGTAATSLRPNSRTFSLTGTMGTAIVPGDIVAMWGSNDGGRTYQPLRTAAGQQVLLTFGNPECVINDACDHYATQRVGVGTGSALVAVGLSGEGVYVNPSPAWVQGGNSGFSPLGVLGTTDNVPISIIANGKQFAYSDGSTNIFGDNNAGNPGNTLFLASGSGGMGISSDGGGSISVTADPPGTIELGALAVRVRRSPAGITVPVEFFDATNAAFVGLVAPAAVTGSYTVTLPVAAPTINGQRLVATTAGVASWAGGAVNVQANNQNAQSIVDGAAAAILTTWTEITDSASAFNAGTGVFTVPAGTSGFYQISTAIEFAAAASNLASQFRVGIFVNGAIVAEGVYVDPVAALNVSRQVQIGIGLQLSAGATVDVRAFQNSGGNVSLTNAAAHNLLSISLVS